MKEYLEKITNIKGVKGVVLINKDGSIIEKIFYDENAELIGTMVAEINKEMESALGKANNEIPILSTIYAEKGEIFFISMKDFILTVLCEKNMNIGVLTIQVKNVISKIQ